MKRRYFSPAHQFLSERHERDFRDALRQLLSRSAINPCVFDDALRVTPLIGACGISVVIADGTRVRVEFFGAVSVALADGSPVVNLDADAAREVHRIAYAHLTRVREEIVFPRS